MKRSRWMGNQNRMGRWEIRNARNAGKKTEKGGDERTKGDEKNNKKKGTEALQGLKSERILNKTIRKIERDDTQKEMTCMDGMGMRNITEG